MHFNFIICHSLVGTTGKRPDKFFSNFLSYNYHDEVYIGSSINNPSKYGRTLLTGSWQTVHFRHPLKKFEKHLNENFKFLETSAPQNGHILLSLLWSLLSGHFIMMYWEFLRTCPYSLTDPAFCLIPEYLFLCKQELSNMLHIFLGSVSSEPRSCTEVIRILCWCFRTACWAASNFIAYSNAGLRNLTYAILMAFWITGSLILSMNYWSDGLTCTSGGQSEYAKWKK